MESLAEAMASKPPLDRDQDDTFLFAENDGDDLNFHNSCLDELDRYRRTDEWLPSYRNILSRTSLKATRILSMANVIDCNPASLIQYTRDGTADELRLDAFDNVFQMGLAKHDAALRWFLFAMGTDTSLYFREHAFRLFGRLLGTIALGQKDEGGPQNIQQDGLVIEQAESTTNARKASLARRTTVQGALAALKEEVRDNEVLKKGLWTAISSTALSFKEIKQLLEICSWLYDPHTTMRIVLKYPRYWRCEKVGKGKVRFLQTSRVRTKPIQKRLPPPAPPVAPASPFVKREDSGSSAVMPPPPPAQRRPIFKPPRRPSESSEASSALPSPISATPADGDAKPKLKIKLKIGPPKHAGSK